MNVPAPSPKAPPLAVDLFAGLGGWTDGLLAEGYDVVGFDLEQHVYGDMRYPAQLVIQDVLTLHGSQFKDAALIVASPPCQFFSYTAMPWTKAKAFAAKVRADPLLLAEELALFKACFRIQREANEANGCAPNGDCIECDGTGNFYRYDEDGDFLDCDNCNGTGRKRYIPMVVENVRGAEPWVGRARWNFGSFYLWGDVPALMPPTIKAHKVPGFRFDGSGRSFQSASVAQTGVTEGRKNGGDWFGAGADCSAQRRAGSKSPARKAASAMIAKIPFPLARWIGRCYAHETLSISSRGEVQSLGTFEGGSERKSA